MKLATCADDIDDDFVEIEFSLYENNEEMFHWFCRAVSKKVPIEFLYRKYHSEIWQIINNYAAKSSCEPMTLLQRSSNITNHETMIKNIVWLAARIIAQPTN